MYSDGILWWAPARLFLCAPEALHGLRRAFAAACATRHAATPARRGTARLQAQTQWARSAAPGTGDVTAQLLPTVSAPCQIKCRSGRGWLAPSVRKSGSVSLVLLAC